ncbi:unnamed protein product [Prunus armeniaca]|uniref:Endonuclease/exonuclease/phosphatase domain-containing protein n=1 Tax=Prunus armeniaca TaxID=36596 RepID=A0A6J5W1M2_PRUAR|nr:unnamed protein product [Prunus armeniaca]CAB4294201.1 unnamed protein product [Prunus armeniaca]
MEVVQRQLGMNGCFSVGRIGISRGVEHIGFRFTWFYGHPETHLRKHSWELLCRLDGNGSGLWVVGGDFNEIL